MASSSHIAPPTAAVVARTERSDTQRYLFVTSAGAPVWVEDPQAATAFSSMREAARMALRLPVALRAFSLPRDLEVATCRMQ